MEWVGIHRSFRYVSRDLWTCISSLFRTQFECCLNRWVREDVRMSTNLMPPCHPSQISGCNVFPKGWVFIHTSNILIQSVWISMVFVDFNVFVFHMENPRICFFDISHVSHFFLSSRPRPRWIATAFVLEVKSEKTYPTKRESRKLLKHTLGGDYLSFQEVL